MAPRSNKGQQLADDDSDVQPTHVAIEKVVFYNHNGMNQYLQLCCLKTYPTRSLNIDIFCEDLHLIFYSSIKIW